MANDHAPETNTERPSTRERINALATHRPLFEHIDNHPQSGVYNRFGKNWSRSLNYIEGEVHRCNDVVEDCFRKRSQILAEGDFKTEIETALKKEMETLLLHRMLPPLHFLFPAHRIDRNKGKVAKASGEAAIAPSLSKVSMDEFRSESGCESNGITRAANGQLLSLYGKMGTPVPGWCATIYRKDFDPAEEVVAKWVMDLLVIFIGRPFSVLLYNIPPIKRRFNIESPDIRFFSARAVAVITRIAMVMVAILCATAAIFTLDVVKKRQIRIFIMALYALAFALPVQFLAPSSFPLYTLIIS
jgi:hypothetical protein